MRKIYRRREARPSKYCVPRGCAINSLHYLMKATLILVLCAVIATVRAETLRVESAAGISAQLDTFSGQYEIAARRPAWNFAGGVPGPARNGVVQAGTDRIGAYREIRFTWNARVAMSGSIRVYQSRPVVLFNVACEKAADSLPTKFPDFTEFPPGLHHFSHENVQFAPPVFALETNGTPWLLFDDHANAAVLSPANDFMFATMAGDGSNQIASGLNAGVHGLPAHFNLQTILVLEPGINAAWQDWGSALVALSGKTVPANDADIGLRYLGYWTDNGANYYYHYDSTLGYAGTLEALAAHYRERAIPIRYLQLDSWWYYKTLTDPEGREGHTKNPELPIGEWNRYGGLLKYEAHPGVLPDGLAAFQKKIGLPLITHNRWIDPASPYHEKYTISGYAAVDPRWWDDIDAYLSDGGVVCYEQDWLNVIYNHSPALSTTVDAGDAFAGGMAQAAQARNMSVQYCMALPRFFLQGSLYPSLTTIRVTDDRFGRGRWDAFLYNCQLAGALGMWPWADVFMSTETDNLLLATLSAGMVGTGDAIGREDRDNLMRVARPNGVIVKPDVPIIPLDEDYLADAAAQKSPMTGWTRVDHGDLRTAYVFAFNRQNAGAETSFTPAELGFTDRVYVLNVRSNSVSRQSADSAVKVTLASKGTAYYAIAPVGKSGLAFFGDEGKFVGNGKKRIADLTDDSGGLTVRVIFSAGEKSVRLFGFAGHAPHASAQSGSVGAMDFDPVTNRFAVDVSPADVVTSESPGGDRIQMAVVHLGE
jgi:hypothetical protein